MQRILNADIVDITPIDGGFIYAEKKMLENGSCRVSFYSYDCETSISTPITRGEYVSCKFGQKILAAVQMQQRGSIVIKGDRLLLLMRDLRIFLDDVFLRISDEM